MSGRTLTFSEIMRNVAEEIYNTAVEKGWYDNNDWAKIVEILHTHGVNETIITELMPDLATACVKPRNDFEMIALVHGELSEAVEALRKGNPPSEKIPQFSHAEEEFADAIIRMLDQARKNNWNIGGAILAKMAYNKTREYRHGNKLA